MNQKRRSNRQRKCLIDSFSANKDLARNKLSGPPASKNRAELTSKLNSLDGPNKIVHGRRKCLLGFTSDNPSTSTSAAEVNVENLKESVDENISSVSFSRSAVVLQNEVIEPIINIETPPRKRMRFSEVETDSQMENILNINKETLNILKEMNSNLAEMSNNLAEMSSDLASVAKSLEIIAEN